ncbi:MAG: hypothetical protein JWN53_1857 [Gemmatimonadetes bacterium]|nr:hypothetical protein [Gemmatimonadota bacterium]
MSVREFSDSLGKSWRAWEITPESIHPITKAEDYLVDCYQTGWLVFETTNGKEKRRLCPYPVRWLECADEDLRQLLGRAEAVPPIKLHLEQQTAVPVTSERLTEVAVLSALDPPDVTDLKVVRTFRYPGGRFWTVCVITHPEDGGLPRLRFTSGARHIEMPRWPREWPDYPDERLMELLRQAAPRPAAAPADPDTPRRRWNDAPESSRG